MNKDWKKEVIQNIKDCGQSLIENAEKIVSDYKYASNFTITCYVSEKDKVPYISVNTELYPEKFIERFNSK